MSPQAALLDMICAVPKPMANDEEWRRQQHEDLIEMTVPQLLAEEARVSQRLLLDTAPNAWFTDRLLAVRRALGHVS
jgi:hypothetical protein